MTEEQKEEVKAENFRAHQKMTQLAKHLAIIAFLIVVLFPIAYIISISLNASGALETNLIPEKISLNNWKYLFGVSYYDEAIGKTVTSSFPILKWLWNSIKVASITSALMLFLSTTSAYALSRFNFKGRNLSILSLMVIQMFPNIMSMVAFYLMLDKLGQYIPGLGTDTHGGLILVYLGGTPFNIWLIKGYFDGLPKSIEESARLDGCNHFQAFYKIILPLSAPILSVVGLLTFINTFSDFILPSILLKSQDQFTFAVGIQIFISEAFSGRWGQFAAACILGAIPISALFYSIHQYIVSGLAAGGSKGG
jgi:maltose/maltodextrin transport system permease protein